MLIAKHEVNRHFSKKSMFESSIDECVTEQSIVTQQRRINFNFYLESYLSP